MLKMLLLGIRRCVIVFLGGFSVIFSTVFDDMFILVQSQASSIAISLYQNFVISPSQAFHMKKKWHAKRYD